MILPFQTRRVFREVRKKVSVIKQETHRLNVEHFDNKMLNAVEITEQYQVGKLLKRLLKFQPKRICVIITECSIKHGLRKLHKIIRSNKHVKL
jgi:hypothetical protein